MNTLELIQSGVESIQFGLVASTFVEDFDGSPHKFDNSKVLWVKRDRKIEKRKQEVNTLDSTNGMAGEPGKPERINALQQFYAEEVVKNGQASFRGAGAGNERMEGDSPFSVDLADKLCYILGKNGISYSETSDELEYDESQVRAAMSADKRRNRGRADKMSRGE